MCCKIRCDGEFCKVLGFWVHLNKSNSNSLLKLTWQIYSFAKSQNQMPSEKKGILQQFAI